jgi:hypothetical protein
LLLPFAALAKDGVSFVVVGDHGRMSSQYRANRVFDAINLMKDKAVKGSREDFDFFVTSGDNLYPNDAYNPTAREF